MPGFLKSLFKPSDKQNHRKSGPLPPGVSFSPTSPTSGQDEIADLAAVLQDKFRHGSHDPLSLVNQLQQQNKNPAEMERLMQALSIVAKEDGRISPYFTQGGTSSSGSSRRLRRKGANSSPHAASDQWTATHDACLAALALIQPLLQLSGFRQYSKYLIRLKSLLEAQQEELLDLQPYAEDHGLPTLRTLRDIYQQAQQGLKRFKSMQPDEQEQALETLVEVLAEGPDYLIDITLVEAIVWQGEVIDAGFGAEIQQVLDKAVLEQANKPATFTRAVESIIAISSALPRNLLDDMEAIDAYKSIGILLNQLQVRLGASDQVISETLSKHSSVHLPASAMSSAVAVNRGTHLQSPLNSPTSTRSTSPDPNFVNISSASDLQQMYGTGPMPTPSRTSSAPQASTSNATPHPPPSPTDTEVSQEIWEYRGNLLTRSALSLVMRQEALAKADSSGQYAGEVSWDDVRNAWIPKWAEKMKPEDLADGELANPNPAEFKVRREDAWGNKIGWRDGVMYYKEEPNFDNVPD